jgi:glucose uptake protein GlcU
MYMQCPVNQIATDFGCFPNDPVGFAQKFYGVGLGFIAGVALLALIYGGYAIMTSRGDPRRVSNGKSYIYYAIAGLLLAIFGYVFIQTVLVDVLHVPGFS